MSNQFDVPWNAKKQAVELNKMITADGGTLHQLESDQEGNPRLPFQRDRDRVVWSKSFKRLAHKTQVFPHLYSDHQRHRLTHSLEVMQLSSSIARSLGLNPILCEAISFAHDLGHTPFGHAGETALDSILSKITYDPEIHADIKGLSRFSHYEQGVDVVSYIDSVDPDRASNGLHLDPLIIEGILKHTYDYTNCADKHKSLSFLLKQTKYDSIPQGPGSLESQAVRICDKISYFVSDIEDGLVVGAIHLDQLEPWKDTIFKSVFDFRRNEPSGDEYRIFRSARDKVLSYIIESVLRHGVDGSQGVLKIDPEDQVKTQFENVYKNLQKKMFTNNIYLLRSNRRAKHIITCLFCQYLSTTTLCRHS